MGYINSIQKKIPYGSNVLIECTRCWFRWEPCKHREWKLSTEILSWLLFLIPWIIYTSWRHINTFCKCPDCWAKFLLEMDWDSNIVDNLIRIKKKQTARFWIIVLLFSILWIYSFTAAMKSGWDKAYNNAYNEVFWVTKSINNLSDPVKYSQQINNAINNTNTAKVEQKVEQPKIEQKVEEKVVSESKEEIKNEEIVIEQPKDPDEEVREKMQNILKQIDYQYSEDVRHKVDSYIWASCSWDCINWIVNIKFSKNLWWDNWVVESAAASRSNNIIRSIPGYFDKLQINYICHDQTITSCTFTEYQTNTMIPKWCESYWYKDTKDEAREKVQNILKEIDKDYAHIDSYVWASCFWDCASSVTTINIEFSENIWWYDFTVKSHAAGWNNKIIKAAPGYFDKIWINYIYKWQTVCSCIFTEYQANTFAPKWCTYYWYKE